MEGSNEVVIGELNLATMFITLRGGRMQKDACGLFIGKLNAYGSIDKYKTRFVTKGLH